MGYLWCWFLLKYINISKRGITPKKTMVKLNLPDFFFEVSGYQN